MENGKQIFQAYRACQSKFDKLSHDHRIMLVNSNYTIRDKREHTIELHKVERELNNFKEKIIYALEKYTINDLKLANK